MKKNSAWFHKCAGQRYLFQVTLPAPPRRKYSSLSKTYICMFIVYAIESCEIKRIYIGHTRNMDERLKYHNSGYVKSTVKDRPWKLVAFEGFAKKDEARWIERSLKKSKGKREKWLRKNRITD